MSLTLADRPTVAVVGAGFSGLLTTLHLLRASDGPRVRLIERRPTFARGTAYSTSNDDHLLNVRAANMSAFPDRPHHFTDWLAAEGEAISGATFVTRARYGGYLQALLREATEATQAGRLLLEADTAVDLQPDGKGWMATLAMGRAFFADAVVLAVGNLPPHLPPGLDAGVQPSSAYFGDPWTASLERLPAAGIVILVGTGLTMVDLALRLHRERPDIRMLALSRRGLQPRRHLETGPVSEPFPLQHGEPARGLVRRLRARAASTDWRSQVDGMRPHVQTIWRQWPVHERSRFLRHLRPWWDVHRHRLAPAVAAKLDHLTGSGALTIAAGRLTNVAAEGEALKVSWTPRGGRDARRLTAVGMINCTGPNGDLGQVADPLLASLVRSGRIRADACRLGLDVGSDGRLISKEGEASPNLYAVGPITRGAFWEITSIPDIRIQAAECAAVILDRVRAETLL